MMKSSAIWSERVRESALLNRVDRVSEVLFGLIMVLTFTGAISIASDGKQEIRELLVGALGCNLAWGLVDAIMYLMNSLAERAADRRMVEAVQRAATAEQAGDIVARALPSPVATILTAADLDRI